jgi:hypothetical protein
MENSAKRPRDYSDEESLDICSPDAQHFDKSESLSVQTNTYVPATSRGRLEFDDSNSYGDGDDAMSVDDDEESDEEAFERELQIVQRKRATDLASSWNRIFPGMVDAYLEYLARSDDSRLILPDSQNWLAHNVSKSLQFKCSSLNCQPIYERMVRFYQLDRNYRLFS